MIEQESVELKYGENNKDGFALVMWAGISTIALFAGVASYENLDLVPVLWGTAVPAFAWAAFCSERNWLEALFFWASIASLVGWIVSIA
jgi:hypothetical protein